MRVIDLLPFLGGVAYKQVQVQVATRTEEYFSGEYGTKQEQYVSGYGTKQEQYITGYQKKTVTEIQGENPYNYNAYTNNMIGCTTNRYATAKSLTNQKATGTTCKLINDWYVEVNNAYISILSRCVESSTVVRYHNSAVRNKTGRYADVYDAYSSVTSEIEQGNPSSEDRREYYNRYRAQRHLGVYNPNSTGSTTVTRQVDDTSRPIYGTRTVTDTSKPIYSTRTITDTSKPIYSTRQVPVYEWQWVEE